MDSWKLAEVRGMLYSLMLKVDTLATDASELEAVQELLTEAQELMDDISYKLDRKEKCMIAGKARNLKNYEQIDLPEEYQLCDSEFRQLFDVIREGKTQADGIFNAFCLAYRAGFETGRQSIKP